MKNKFSITFACLLLATLSFAQKERYTKVNTATLSLPVNPLDKEVNTYSVEIKNRANLSALGIDKDVLKNQIQLEAFSLVEKGEPELKVRFTIESFGNLSPQYVEVTQKEGPPRWKAVCRYNVSVSYELYVNGRSLEAPQTASNFTITPTSKKQSSLYESSTFANRVEAQKYWSSKGKVAAYNKITKELEGSFKRQILNLKNEVDYYSAYESVYVMYLKTTKKMDFTDYQNTADQMVEVLGQIRPKATRGTIKTALAEPIAFWEAKLKTLNLGDKKQKKIGVVCLLNIAEAYYWMDDLNKASDYYAKAKALNVMGNYVKPMNNRLERRKATLAQAKASGIDPYKGIDPASDEELAEILRKQEAKDNAREAEIAARIEREKMLLAPVIEAYNGFIVDLSGNKKQGTFKWYKKNTNEREGKIYFIEQGTSSEKEISSSFAERCEFEGHVYTMVMHGDVLSGKDKTLMEVLYESDKVKVLYHEHYTSESHTLIKEIHMIRPGEPKTTNTSNAQYLVAYKKSLANYFADCPVLAEDIRAGKYPNSKNMRVAAATAYTDSCQ